MKFDAKTILQELKKLKDKPTAELVFDWSIVNAWANRLNESKETPEFIKKKFGDVNNFSKYATALYTELKRRDVKVKLKDCLKSFVKVNENTFTVMELYEACEDTKQRQKQEQVQEQ